MGANFSHPPQLQVTVKVVLPSEQVAEPLHSTSPQGVPLHTGGVVSTSITGSLVQKQSPIVAVVIEIPAPETH